jgi:hypothetical protein
MTLLATDNEYDYVKDYYNFISKRLNSIQNIGEFALVGNHQFDTKDNAIIYINYEHNLVHPSVQWYPHLPGKIKFLNDSSENYQVRIENINSLINCKYYIEYSMPNIINIKSCDSLIHFYDKLIYIPALLCEYNPTSISREIYDVITSFLILNPEGRPRRKIIHDRLQNNFANKYYNIPSIFGQDLYDNYYKKSKILINLHQTDFHHTFEELRVLPALLNGLIVISEESPLKETIPYFEYIIWCKYEDIFEKSKEVLNKYEYYYEKIHGQNSNLKNIIKKMEKQLTEDLESKFLNESKISLSEIFDKAGSDKGTYFTHKGQNQNIAHYYTLIYEQQMEQFREQEFNFLEIGIWSPYYPGASVKAWTEYFKNVNFFGIDIEEGCKVLQSEKVNIDIVDQTSEQQLSKYISDKPKFKFIIDDGCHVEDAIIISLGTLFPQLESGGIYYIEDLHVVDKTRLYGLFYKRFQSNLISQSKIDYINSNIDWVSFSPDGKLCIIKKK